LRASFVASDAAIEAALESVKLIEGICEVGNRFALQTLSLDQPGTRRRIPEGSFKVPNGLNVVVGLFRPAASLPATASPRSRMSFMITSGFASAR
jgi:hypothetical protein